MSVLLNEIDKVEILTLQDNYIDLLAGDSNDIVQRAMPLQSLMAEHGFSAVITVTNKNKKRSILFDFGFSSNGAANNADILKVDYDRIEAMVLSHGHVDHFGGMLALSDKVDKKGIDFVVQPEAFRQGRCVRLSETEKINMPAFNREMTDEAGVNLIEAEGPHALLDGDVLFLGQIPRKTSFEKGAPYNKYHKNGKETWDDITDDTALVMNVKGKGLVIISGCAHSGIINTGDYAKAVSGVDDVLAVMGGFHLAGPAMAPAVDPTIDGLKQMDPEYVVPTHCTGREAVMQIEKEMPDQFILNMTGTRLTFSAYKQV